ncbi:Fasciclin-domain-containing protein [Fomitiporia mediterranea MF3/22]|uniref:Fasciclin-domain-containing protein n=1 Tax=Fomitiporia mediterranea (strain MF3/22) TaxID=694068 RepID=UPI000440972E|nr:Fasciclin-domain-containing protein [Fomitiporia mediterranea MF3/22]EJD02748.1 Fasciclin-domain-containing protein [Fomitiporia mediterranea MF3/22]
MRAFATFSLLSCLAAPIAAQNVTFLTQFLQELQNLGLTSLANVSTAINSTTTGQTILASLSSGPLTVFAPNNEAWAGAHPNITGSAELLAEVLSYHVVPGTFNVTPSFPNTTVGRTLLNSSDLVFLEGNKHQVLAWTDRNGTVDILNQNTPSVVVNSSTVGNITLHVTSAVIDVPGDFDAAVSANNLSAFRTALQSASLFDALNTQHGVTVFAPSDAAFERVQQNLTSAGSNATILSNILKNHVINGTSVYSGNLIGLGSSNETTAAGEGLRGNFNSSGGFVTVGNSTGKITTPDVILWNGVMHIIDTVLFDEDSDASAASSAVSSANAAATASTTESGPVGFTQTAASAGAPGASSSSAAGIVNVPFAQTGLASAVSLLGAVFGGLAITL